MALLIGSLTWVGRGGGPSIEVVGNSEFQSPTSNIKDYTWKPMGKPHMAVYHLLVRVVWTPQQIAV